MFLRVLLALHWSKINSRPMKLKLYPASAGFLLFSTIANLMTNLPTSAASFGDDVAFLQKHTDVVVLHDPSNAAQIAVAPAW